MGIDTRPDNGARPEMTPFARGKGAVAMATKHGSKAKKKVEKSMHEYQKGKLKSGKSKKPVKSRKQAIAVGLSKARKAGGKVPAKKKR
jgi:hypothetical protein